MDWQPIATAPKDGTLVIICERSGRVQVAKWCDAAWGGSPNWWCQLTSGGTDYYPTTDVTHWLPIPPLPKR